MPILIPEVLHISDKDLYVSHINKIIDPGGHKNVLNVYS